MDQILNTLQIESYFALADGQIALNVNWNDSDGLQDKVKRNWLMDLTVSFV